MFTVHNNAGEEVGFYMVLESAIKFAKRRSEQLCGARHYVMSKEQTVLVFETK